MLAIKFELNAYNQQTIINQYLERMQSNSHMPSSVSTDMKVISTYLETSLESKVQPRNLSELSTLVKNRLEQKMVSKDKKSNCRQWLQNKGMNIQPLLDYIATRKRRQKEEIKTQQKQEILGVPVLQPTLFNHQEYSQKAAQYASASILKYVPSNRAIKKRYFRNAMERLHCQFQDLQPTSFPSSILTLPTTVTARNIQKKNVYIKTVKKLLDFEVEIKNKKQINFEFQQTDKVAKLFFQDIPVKIWTILYRQVKNVDFSMRKQTIMTQILINSLFMVEEQFNEELPLNKQAINYYLQQRYLSRIDRNGEYEFDQEHGSIWGKIFLFFRAGRFKEVNSLLQKIPQKELARQIIQNHQNILKKMPRKTVIDPFLTKTIKDIFREQILYAIGGQKKYSSELLADISTLDCVWVLLRNTGIYYQTDGEVFEEMRFQMAKYYKQNRQERQNIYNAAYLADYDSIMQMSENDILDKDDLLHLLIVMQRYPSLIKEKKMVSQKLAEMAVSYIVELAEEKREEIVYYMLVLPEERIVEDASSIIAGYKLYLTFDWNLIKKYLSSELFGKLVKESSKKFVISTRNYLQAAINLSTLIDDKETSLNLLTEMFVIHYEQKKIYDQEDVIRALKFYNRLIQQSSELGKDYFRLLELFDSLHNLSKASRSRNYRSIEDMIKKTSLIFFQNIDYYNAKMLDKLMEMNGLDVYFLFLSNMSRAADYIYNVQAELQLKQLNYLLFKTATTVFNHEKYKLACLYQGITRMMNQLGEKAMESVVQDYKNYF